MAVSAYDKVLPWDPINYFQIESNLGKDRLDKEEKKLEEIDKNSSIFNSLNPAPGHEQYAQKVTSKYESKNKEALDLIDKGEIDKANRIIRRTKYEFINDPQVKTIANSRDAYDKKWSMALNDPKNKGAIYNMPGVLDDQAQFMQNEQSYDNLNYVPPSPFMERINDYLSKVPITKTNNKGSGYVRTDKEGNRIFEQPIGYTETRDDVEFKRAIPGLARTMMNPTDPDYAYFKAKFERENGQGSFNQKNVEDYMYNLSQAHRVNNDMRDVNSQFIRESASAQQKEQSPLALPQLQINQNAQNIPTKEKTVGVNFYDNNISIPYLGSSSMKVNQPIGVDGRYTLGSRKSYIIGDDGDESASEYGAPITNQKSLYNARVTDHVIGYKILSVPQGGSAEGKPGNIVTVGSNYGSVGSTDLNRAPVQDEETRQYYILNADNEKIIVEPVALRVLKGSESEGSDASDSENIFFEEMPRKESLKYFGGKNFSNEKFIEYNSEGKLTENLDQTTANKLLTPLTNSPKVVQTMNEYSELKNRVRTKGYKITPRDLKVIGVMNDLLEEQEYQQEVVPGIITPKTEYTPKGVLGTEQN